MTLLQDIEWEEPLVEAGQDRELERWLKERIGLVPPAMRYFFACPPLVRMWAELELAPLLHVDHELSGLVSLVVSQDNSCRFCYAATRLLLSVIGMPDERIRGLEHALQTTRHDPRVEPALDFARRISRSNRPPSAADKKALIDAGYGDGAIRELAFTAAEVVLANRMSTLLALPPQRAERFADSWLPRLLRPLLAWRLRPLLRRTGQPEYLADDLKRGPYAYLVLTLDGLPAAKALRSALDELWASPHTTARAKALVFAVVARGLGSRRAEREALRLVAEGGLAQESAERVLGDLGGPGLDPVEAAVVPYGRETLWYEPAPIQRRGRALLEQLTLEQLLEVVGVASLANMVCRLDAALDEP
jgi:alkylhydroperoxidase family enzyme